MRTSLTRLAVAAGLAATLLSGCAGKPPAAPASGPRRDVTGQLTAARAYLTGLARQRQFSGTVLVAMNGHVLLQGGYGWADAASHVPNRPATRFRIASLTKQFTAMAIMQLQNEGRLKVTDHVCTFITGCPPAWQPVTLAELLTHTSGIPDYETLAGYSRLSQQNVTPGALAALVAKKPLLFRPGTRWSYSNTGYVLLGMVVQRASGQTYAGFLGRHVFAPLGLGNTGYDVDHPAPPGHATGYTSPYRTAPYINMSVPSAAGALYSTIGDLHRWDDALLNGRPRLVTPGTLRQIFHPWIAVQPGQPSEGAYGYGWFIDLNGAEYDHDGEINGFVSGNAVFPRARAEIIILSNLESADVRTITEHLAAFIGVPAR